MVKYKVVYYIGEEIDLKTKVESGFIIGNIRELKLVSKTGADIKDFADVKEVSLFMMHGLGSMLKIKMTDCIFFVSVVRFCIAGKFAMGNAVGTRKLKDLLD